MAGKQFDLSVIFRVIDKATRPVRKIGISLKKLGIPIKRLIKSFRKLGKSIQKVGDRMVRIGKAMILRVAAPLFLLGFLMSRTSRIFETAFTGIRKTVDATEPQFKKLKVQLMALARELGIATEEIFGLAEAAGQLDIQTENIAKFSEIMAKLGIAAPILEMEQAAVQIAQFANVTRMSQKDFDRFASTLVFLGNTSATFEDKILNMTERIGSAAAGAGIAHAEILGLATALAQLAIKPEAGGSALSKIIIEITAAVAKGNKELGGIAAVAGFKGKIKEFKKLWKEDAVGALILFVEGLENLPKVGLDAVVVLDDLGMGALRVGDLLRRVSGNSKLFNETIKAGTNAWKENIALNEEVSKRMKDVQKQLDIVKENARQTSAAFGDELNVVLLKVLKRLDPFITKLRELDVEMKQLILIIGGGTIGLVGALVGLGATLKFVGWALAGLTLSTGVFGLMLISLGLLAFSVQQNFDDLKDTLSNLWDDPIAELKLWVDAFKLMAEDFWEFEKRLAKSLIFSPIITAWEYWSKIITDIIDKIITGPLASLDKKLENLIDKLRNFLISLGIIKGTIEPEKEPSKSEKSRSQKLTEDIKKFGFEELVNKMKGVSKKIDPLKEIQPKESLAEAVKRVMTEKEPIKSNKIVDFGRIINMQPPRERKGPDSFDKNFGSRDVKTRNIEAANFDDKKLGSSEVEIDIKVTAEPGTTAVIEKVKRKRGDAKVSVATTGFVGAMP